MRYRRIDSFLAPEQCAALLRRAMPQLTPAKVGPANDRQYVGNARNAFNIKLERKPFSHLAIAAANSLSGTRERQAEATEIVCYPPGGEFIRHHDGSHRSHSLIVFLNEGYSGGELTFDTVDFAKMPTGAAIIWENTPDAWHACEPITRGLKWAALFFLSESPA